ncbi:uncharacterized protein LOC141834688 [Curcuma longa]|uniref:uncharacterized protein LOC141834688 n=1 Tax=Curcuma longa TaxID=136217 RepID=UPI003D9DF172
MRLWVKILPAAISAAAAVLLFLILCRRRRNRRLLSAANTPRLPQSASKARSQSLQAGIAKLQLAYRSSAGRKASFLFHHLHYDHELGGEAPSRFDWEDHPRLEVEAVEHGWSRFVFAGCRPQDAAAQGSGEGGGAVDANWEVLPGSSEFSQTVSLRPSGRTLHREGAAATARMLLPLPGPRLGLSSFPQEAYFEITVLCLKPTPPPPPPPSRTSKRTESTDADPPPIQELNACTKEEGQSTTLSLGLCQGGAFPSGSFCGTYPGSIGFHSNGCVYLDGKKLIFESEKAEWSEANRVIGCGFDPRRKKVFFTVDSRLMHVIHCQSDMYKAPLFPILGSNADAMILVNLGQSRFKYQPANAHRTPNPCFVRSSSVNDGTAAISDDDSRELFSMGRIDSHWFDAAKKSQSASKKSHTADADADSDLFEISLQI